MRQIVSLYVVFSIVFSIFCADKGFAIEVIKQEKAGFLLLPTVFLLITSHKALAVYPGTYKWPIGNPPQTSTITSTLDEHRHNATLHRFHRGVDVDATQGTNAYYRLEVNGTVLDKAGNNVLVKVWNSTTYDAFWYEHLSVNANLPMGDGALTNGTKLGTTDAQNHLHFEHGRFNSSYWNDTVQNERNANFPEYNPLDSSKLDPQYSPQFNPRTDWVKFYKDETNTVYTVGADGKIHLPLNTNLDIVIKACAPYNSNTDCDHPSHNHTGVYKGAFQIVRNSDGSVIYPKDYRLIFDYGMRDTDQNADLHFWVYKHDPNDPDAPRHRLVLTNNINSDTDPDATDSNSSITLTQATEYTLTVYVKDILTSSQEITRTETLVGDPNVQAPLAPAINLTNAYIPIRSSLLQAYPSPANPETWIPFAISQDADVSVRIYDSKGNLVRTLNLGRKEAGYYTSKSRAAYWDGRNEAGERVASGIYFYQIQAGPYTQTRKTLVVK